jgi:hypothetical protein
MQGWMRGALVQAATGRLAFKLCCAEGTKHTMPRQRSAVHSAKQLYRTQEPYIISTLAPERDVSVLQVGAPARVGLVAPVDVTVPAGNTGLDPSQTNFFQVTRADIIWNIHTLDRRPRAAAPELAAALLAPRVLWRH